jgi:hypothetical protein
MSDETVTEAECVLCRDLDASQRIAMRADLLVIPSTNPSAREPAPEIWTGR